LKTLHLDCGPRRASTAPASRLEITSKSSAPFDFEIIRDQRVYVGLAQRLAKASTAAIRRAAAGDFHTASRDLC
jgi:hypothetical protein